MNSANSPAPPATHRHTIRLEDLIVHRYSERAALMKKADAIARSIIMSELRDGESYRVAEDGVYVILLPRLTPEAGALRCSLLAQQIAREVRKVNPTATQLERTATAAAPRRIVKRTPSRPARSESSSLAAVENASQEAATRAFERMIDVGQAGQVHELTFTEDERAAFSRMKLRFHPIWNVRNRLITGYRCALSLDGRDLSIQETAAILKAQVGVLTKAKIDTIVYTNAVAGVQKLLQAGQKALFVIPVHFSTVDHMRFIVPLLDAGGALPPEAQSLIVFEFLEIPQNTSQFRLREPSAHLRPRCRALLARVGFDFTSLDAFRELNFHGISIDMADYPWSETRVLPFFEAFTAAAQRQKLQPFVHGIRSASLTVAAVSAGFSYIGGPAVAAPMTAPATVRSFAVESLYLRDAPGQAIA